jgi:glycosyltransferase involved in cell wall biosynthesis
MAEQHSDATVSHFRSRRSSSRTKWIITEVPPSASLFLSDVIGAFPEASFVSISDNQRRPLPDANWVATIPHGLPKDLFRPSFESGSYLAFLGRLTAEKGRKMPYVIARAVGMPLRIAAKKPRAETANFKKKLEPEIDGEEVQLVGEVDEVRKQPFLAGASAMLFPIDWPEPFGLVMIEAMACGTPVIAYRSGSVPEVVDDGVTGFIVESEKQAMEAVKKSGPVARQKKSSGPVRGAIPRESDGERVR